MSTLAAVSGDRDLAVDAADEAAARALAAWQSVGVMARPDGWMYRVGLNYLRRQGRRRALEAVVLRRQPAVGHVDGPTGEIWLLVAALSPRQREAVALRHLARLSEPEIAEVMGIRRGTVSSTLRAAYANLAETVRADPPAGDQEEPGKSTWRAQHAKP